MDGQRARGPRLADGRQPRRRHATILPPGVFIATSWKISSFRRCVRLSIHEIIFFFKFWGGGSDLLPTYDIVVFHR